MRMLAVPIPNAVSTHLTLAICQVEGRRLDTESGIRTLPPLLPAELIWFPPLFNLLLARSRGGGWTRKAASARCHLCFLLN